jgi:hypothetical protein
MMEKGVLLDVSEPYLRSVCEDGEDNADEYPSP